MSGINIREFGAIPNDTPLPKGYTISFRYDPNSEVTADGIIILEDSVQGRWFRLYEKEIDKYKRCGMICAKCGLRQDAKNQNIEGYF